ncbi:helix-turn-helix domain-containing protein [Pseudoduganella ginsengisoli]
MHTTSPTSTLPAKVRFGHALRAAREMLGMSQEELAERAGLHRTYIGQVERGERNISVDSMERLAAAVKIDLWIMLTPK